jgi:diguanylate cyclase (GGDEF)-like protein
MFVSGKGFIFSNMKAVQANLRHLTWQAKQVAEGDFSQKVEFLGEFSTSFNEMAAKLQGVKEELEHLAYFDVLMQIPNRRSAIQYLEQFFNIYKRNNRMFSILILDIDYFKLFNDTYGHDTGDKVLKQTSQTAKNVFRESDIFCRLGGEEFIAILPETTLEGAAMIAERVRTTVMNAPIGLEGEKSLNCTVSIGISQVLPGDEDYSAVMARSDEALYQAKKDGRNKTCSNPELDIDEIVGTAQQRGNQIK